HTWQGGDCKFSSGAEVSYEESFVPIPVEEILLHSVRDEEAAKERQAAAPADRSPSPTQPAPPRPLRPSGPAAAPARAPADPERRSATLLPLPALPSLP